MKTISARLQEIIALDRDEKEKLEVIIHFIKPRPVLSYKNLHVHPQENKTSFPAEVLTQDGLGVRFGYFDFIREPGTEDAYRTVTFEFDARDVSIVETRRDTGGS